MRKLALIALALAAAAQTVEPGPQVATFFSDVDDSDQPYALYVPPGYTASRAWPLVISLHGAGSNHRLNLRRVFGRGNVPGETEPPSGRGFPPLGDVEFLVASPLARGDMGYQGIGEKDVLDVLAEMKRRFRVDEDRVYLTGLSLGGGGALSLGLTRPDIWAAVAAVCPAVPKGLESFAANALNLPIRLMQGEIDPIVPAAQTRAWHRRLLDAGVASEYIEYRSVRHNAWDFAYKDRAIFDWFARYKRNSRPTHIVFTTQDYAHASAYWLRFDRLTPGTPASADARVVDGRLVILTSRLDAFTIQGDRLPLKPGAITIDGTPLRLRPGAPLRFRKTEKGWTTSPAGPSERSKQPGAEGPIGAAVATRHMYVYGTAGTSSPEVVSQRRQIAQTAADWSTPQHRLLLKLRALSDVEATPQETAGANLVLFGTRATNRRIDELSASLPLHLNESAADYGLVYVYPVGGRYIVISSGLPWWTRLDQAKRPGLPWVAPAWRTLGSFGDFILFRGGLDSVVTEGRFDNQWRLPPLAAEAMRATGAVTIIEPK